MSDPLHSSAEPPPKWNRWIIYAAFASIIGIVVLMALTPGPDDVAPDAPLGVNKQDTY